MNVQWNCAGGDTVFLTPGDQLDAIPESHRHLLTSAIQTTFEDPIGYFASVAAQSPFESVNEYLLELIQTRHWQLRLHTNGFNSRGIAAFAFGSNAVLPSEIAPAEQVSELTILPELAQFYSLLGWVHWTEYGAAGGIDRFEDHTPCRNTGYKLKDESLQDQTVKVWGSTPCGDTYIYTRDGRGGLLSHETGQLHFLGSIEEAIDWIFNKLRQGTYPDFDYSWIGR